LTFIVNRFGQIDKKQINTQYNRNNLMSNQQFDMRSTLNLLNSMTQGRQILNEGRVGQIADDLESLSDAEFFKEYGKTKSEKRKEFSGDKSSAISEGISNANEDPNLRIAYNMGHKAYQAYKDDPQMAQQAQDRIEAEFPQYLKMWTTGYRDGERFDKSGVTEDSLKKETVKVPVGTRPKGIGWVLKQAGEQSGKDYSTYERTTKGVSEARPDVMRHKGDTTVKLVKKAGKPIGEIGIDAEASEGNGQYYVKLYDGSYDASGFDTAEEAFAELKYAVKQMSENMAEGEGMSRAAKGYEKYGKAGMQALAAAGRDGASEKKLDDIRTKYNKYSDTKK
jgi:hypothetical protein